MSTQTANRPRHGPELADYEHRYYDSLDRLTEVDYADGGRTNTGSHHSVQDRNAYNSALCPEEIGA